MKLYTFSKAISAAIQFTEDSSKADFSEVYGSLFSEYPMGYNFEVLVRGSAKHKNKLIGLCNQLHGKYDHSLINKLAEFSGVVPTFEVVGKTMYKFAQESIQDPLLVVKLKVDDKNWVEVKSTDTVQVTRSYKINCVHRHHNPDLTMNENKELYGKCSAIHGHEYTVEVSLRGKLDDYGQVISPDELDRLVNKNLIEPFHKTYLNDEMGNTSGELISELFYKNLSPVLPSHLTFDLTLRETRKNSFVKLASNF